jgi:hypothetical protein
MFESIGIIVLAVLAVVGLTVLISVLSFAVSIRGAAPGFEEGIPGLNR